MTAKTLVFFDLEDIHSKQNNSENCVKNIFDMINKKMITTHTEDVFQSIRVIALHGYGPSHSMAVMTISHKNNLL